MNSREIIFLLDEIASRSSRNEKEHLIRENISDECFLFVLKAALDPFVTYGIGTFPVCKENTSGKDICFEELGTLLGMLADRRLSGNAAKDALVQYGERLNFDSAELLQRIVLKDLRAGFSESTVNKIRPGTITTFDCMLAHPFSKFSEKVKYPVAVEPKLDGVRVLSFVDVKARTVKFFSRSGREFTTFDHLIEHALSFAECLCHDDLFSDGKVVLDSEVVSGVFNETVSQVRKKDVQATDAKLYVFDALPYFTFANDEKKGCQLSGTYSQRRDRLEIAQATCASDEFVKILPLKIANEESEVYELYQSFRSMNLEGAIVKDMSGLYERKRSKNWLKIKAEESVDVRVVGWISGTGKYLGMIGALVVDFNGVEVNVGSGLTDGLRGANPRELLDRLIEVEYHEITPDGSLRHPRFKRFRDDKDTDDS